MQIDCTESFYFCIVKLKKYTIMGFFDYLLLGAFLNSMRNNRHSNNDHSSYSNDNYNRGYNDGYNDACMDHDDYDCDCSDCCDGDGFFDF